MAEREVRYEFLRPAQLKAEMERAPLVFLPVAPLEYHGPHLPLGMDSINATECALGACRKLGKGVVMPTLHMGTERERPEWMLESLGFDKKDWVIGMDFPTATWSSHYYPEHIFGLTVASHLEMLIGQGYRAIVVVNGHGAWNQLETLERLSKHYTHTSPAVVKWKLAIVLDISERNLAGHADLVETSLMLYYDRMGVGSGSSADLSALPPRAVPIHYKDFSVVDGPGFSEKPGPDRVVKNDPRDATADKGRSIFEDTAAMYAELGRETLAEAAKKK